jgi:Coenzyme PQQ synthesis protein D (PqqD)
MNTILIGASYLQNSDPLARSQAVLTSICERSELAPAGVSLRIWDLLETPQTVGTICRMLSNEWHLDPKAFHPAVEALFAELYARDLIELSPDT